MVWGATWTQSRGWVGRGRAMHMKLEGGGTSANAVNACDQPNREGPKHNKRRQLSQTEVAALCE